MRVLAVFDFSNPAVVLQLLDKKKLHVLVALFCLPLPTSEMSVARMISCSRKTARETLWSLAALGLVARGAAYAKSPWILTVAAHQLPLPFEKLHENGTETAVFGGVMGTSEGKNYPHQLSTTTTLNREESGEGSSSSNTRLDPRTQNCTAGTKGGTSEGKNYPHRQKLSTGSAKPVDNFKPGLIAAFQKAGIGRNMWHELAALDWVTAEYVVAHSRLRKEETGDIPLMIFRMREGDGTPVFEFEVCPDCGSRIRNGLDCLRCSGVIKS